MNCSFRAPTDKDVRRFADGQRTLASTYQTENACVPAGSEGWLYDQNRVLVGQGLTVFIAACHVVRQWRHFPQAWVRAVPDRTPAAAGDVVVSVARFAGAWWLNACRVVDVQEPGPWRAGSRTALELAYATLPAHAEQGEERFRVSIEPDGAVWYEIEAVSRPGHWLARLGFPLLRRLQKRFAAESLQTVVAETAALVAEAPDAHDSGAFRLAESPAAV